MRTLSSIALALSTLLLSCHKAPLPGEVNTQAQTGLDFANDLKKWSEAQPQPFVIAFLGDTSQGNVGFEGNLISNVTLDPVLTEWFFHDSLFIDTSYALGLTKRLSDEQLKVLVDSASLPLSENQMAQFLEPLGLKLRIMKFDSATYLLCRALVDWGDHQNPPQTVRSGFYTFVYPYANFGGYTRVFLRFEGPQNLEYFTRKFNKEAIEGITRSINRSLTRQQLSDLLAPVVLVQYADTWWGSE